MLDPEIQDDVRVTVVATGLNRQAATLRATGREHDRREREREPVAAVERPIRVVRNATTGAVDYGAVTNRGTGTIAGRATFTPGSEPAAPATPRPEVDDYLDIPAFLRRQAD